MAAEDKELDDFHKFFNGEVVYKNRTMIRVDEINISQVNTIEEVDLSMFKGIKPDDASIPLINFLQEQLYDQTVDKLLNRLKTCFLVVLFENGFNPQTIEKLRNKIFNLLNETDVIAATNDKFEIFNFSFNPAEVEKIKAYFKNKILNSAKEFNNLQSAKSPYFKDNEKNLYIITHAFSDLISWLDAVAKAWQSTHKIILRQFNFPESNPAISDFINFFRHYFVDSYYSKLCEAYEVVFSVNYIAFESFTEADFHNFILSEKIKEFKNLFLKEFSSMPTLDSKRMFVSENYFFLTDISAKSRRLSPTFKDKNIYNQIFVFNESPLGYITRLLESLNNDFPQFIDKSLIVTKSFRSFLQDSIREFHVIHMDNSLDQNTSLINAAQLLDSTIAQFEFSLDVFIDKYVTKRNSNNPEYKKISCLNDFNNFIKPYLKPAAAIGNILIHDYKGNPYNFEKSFFDNSLLLLFNKINQTINIKIGEYESSFPAASDSKYDSDFTPSFQCSLYPGNKKKFNENLANAHDYMKIPDNKLLHKDTMLMDFKKLFQNINISKLVIWTGDLIDLHYFLKRLKASKFITSHKYQKIGVCCFYHRKEGIKMNYESFSTITDEPSDDRKKIIENAISKLTGL